MFKVIPNFSLSFFTYGLYGSIKFSFQIFADLFEIFQLLIRIYDNSIVVREYILYDLNPFKIDFLMTQNMVSLGKCFMCV